MHILGQSGLIHISLKYGLIWAVSMKAATIRFRTPSMRMHALLSWIRITQLLLSDYSCCAMLKRMAGRYLQHLDLRTCIPPLMPIQPYMRRVSAVLPYCFSPLIIDPCSELTREGLPAKYPFRLLPRSGMVIVHLGLSEAAHHQ
jgi:hypothetical protein